MSATLNRVEIIGNVGKDPEIRHTQAGNPIANLSVATSESWRDKQTGETREKTEWHRVVCFSEGLSKVIEQYVKKGSKVYIAGSLQTRKWTDKDGVEKYSTEIIMKGFDAKLLLLNRVGGDGERDDTPRQARAKPDAPSVGGGGSLDDEIPFSPEWR